MPKYVIKHTPSGQYLYNDSRDDMGMIMFTKTILAAMKYDTWKDANSKLYSSEFEVEEIKDD